MCAPSECERAQTDGRSLSNAPPPEAVGTWPLPRAYDFFETTRMLRIGSRDPTLFREPDGLWRTAHTLDGPATVRLKVGETLRAAAWGPGASAVMQDVPRWVGLHESQWELPSHPVTDALLRRHKGLRGTDTRDVFEALLVAVLHQLVTWVEAAASWRRLCQTFGEPAPGPLHHLRLSPTPSAIRVAGTARLEQLGIGSQRARTLMEVALRANGLQKAAELPTAGASQLLQSVRGVGAWSAAHVLGYRLSRPEPVLVGDYHLPNTVAWVLAGEPRGTEARMLELLRPFEGHAFRVVRLLNAARIRAPRRGPRRSWR